MDYLLKSMLCLLVLLLIHRVLLQREVLHRFNRFYLLASVLGSFLIPLYTIEVTAPKPATVGAVNWEAQQVPLPEYENLPEEFATGESVEATPPNLGLADGLPAVSFPWEKARWIGYIAVSLVFLYRFLGNISRILAKVRHNPHRTYRGETLVLHPDNQSPFSFLKYIFFPKAEFEESGIPEAVFVHERCHVREKHSWDILLIELLLVFFWFHPGLYLARQAIRLNHEFLADQAALQATSLEHYRSQLLSMMVSGRPIGLASSLNFPFTKKRFEMMKKNAKNPFRWMKVLMLVPLIGALVYFFGEKVAVQSEEEGMESQVPAAVTSIEEAEMNIRILSDRVVEVDGQSIPIEELSKWLDEIKASQPIVRFSANPGVKMGTLADLQEILTKMEIRHVIFDKQDQAEEAPDHEKVREAYYRNAYILVEDKNMVYTHKSYDQLSEKEKMGLFGPLIPRDKEHPDPVLFESWKDHKTYAIWIDWEVISNEKLNEYTAADFVGFFQSNVKESARSKSFPQPYQVHLYTDDYYDKNFGPEAKHRQPRTSEDTVTLTSRLVTWNKDIQKYPDPNTAYLQKNARYEKLRTSGTIYSQKSTEEKVLLDSLYHELDNEYSQSSDKRKKSLKEPILPSSDTRRNGDPAQGSSEKTGAQTVRNSGDNDVFYTLAFSPGLRSDALKEYLTLYGKYQTKAYENRIFSQPSKQEIEQLHVLFRSLEAGYNRLHVAEKRTVKRATFPYAALEVDGKIVFKKFEDLSAEERQGLGC